MGIGPYMLREPQVRVPAMEPCMEQHCGQSAASHARPIMPLRAHWASHSDHFTRGAFHCQSIHDQLTSSSATDTMLLTPFSSADTPYSVSQHSMVPLR